jgi:hypothetical protein
VRVSTVKKSHARMPWAWERRNSVHVGPGSAWSGTQTMAEQDGPDGRAGDPGAQLHQLSADPLVAPSRILPS